MKNKTTVEVSRSAVHRRAYERWQLRGCPAGSPEEDWLAAEQELAVRPSRVVRKARARSFRVRSLEGSSPVLLAALVDNAKRRAS